MKILMVGPSPKTRGGISSVISAYKNSSLWKDYSITWISSYYDKNILLKIVYFFRGLFHFLYKLPGADLIHIHLSEPISALRKSIFFIIAKIFFKSVILHFHSFDSKTSIDGRFKSVYRFLFSHAKYVIVLSPYWENEVKKYINNCLIKVIYNPFTSNIKFNFYKKEKIILFAGTLNERKGYSILIEGFAYIAKKFPEWKIVFAGNGEIDNARKLVINLHIENQVEFLGWVYGDKKNEIFSKSMIFCLPSYAEGFPMAILDAFSFGLPVVSTKCGRIDLILNEDKEILFFNIGNSLELSQCLERLIINEELRNMIGKNGCTFAKNNFDLEVVATEIKKLYRTI